MANDKQPQRQPQTPSTPQRDIPRPSGPSKAPSPGEHRSMPRVPVNPVKK